MYQVAVGLPEVIERMLGCRQAGVILEEDMVDAPLGRHGCRKVLAVQPFQVALEAPAGL